MAASEAINDLALESGRVLLKATVGEEDWQEWLDLRDALEDALPEIDNTIKGILERTARQRIRICIDDFDSRLEARFPDFFEQLKQERDENHKA